MTPSASTEITYSLRYPRRVFIRKTFLTVGKLLMRLLTRFQLSGRDHLPKGAYIMVGNHVAMLEVPMMMMYGGSDGRIVEMIQSGDLPLDPSFQFFERIYGKGIPIKQGSVDTKGLTMALDVLKQGGIVGLFPEGGVWEVSVKDAHTGAAWLSSRAGVPVVPVGFGGTTGALGAAFRFKRPKLVMNIGKPIPAVTADGKARKTALKDATEQIMNAIQALVPEEEKALYQQIRDERFALEVTLLDANNRPVDLPAEHTITEGAALSKFFHRPVLLSAFARNLKLPVEPLQALDGVLASAPIADAADAILRYLSNDNKAFLTYRFGTEVGAAMQKGITQLRDLARWAAAHGYQMTLTPIRRYKIGDDPTELVEYKPGKRHA